MAFKALVENRFQYRIRTLYSNNGGEFIGLRPFLATHGISHFTSPPHTPEHNGQAERKHHHVVETGLALLSHASLPKPYWTYAFAAAVYLINRMQTEVLQGESPYAKLFQTSPNYLKLRVFGCLCYPWIRPYNTNKLESRSTSCVFLGYSLTQSAYLCLDVATGRIYTYRHVRFVENVFPFAPPQSHEPAAPPPQSSSGNNNVIPILQSSTHIAHSTLSPCSNLHSPSLSPSPSPSQPERSPPEPVSQSSSSHTIHEEDNLLTGHVSSSGPTSQSPNISPSNSSLSPQHQTKHQPSHYQDLTPLPQPRVPHQTLPTMKNPHLHHQKFNLLYHKILRCHHLRKTTILCEPELKIRSPNQKPNLA